MVRPNTAKPAAAVTANGPRERDRLGGAISSKNKPSSSFSQEIAVATEAAEDLILLWRLYRSLSQRMRLAKLKFDHDGFPAEEQEDLEREVKAFGRLVRSLKGVAP
jgi:hypothetical protein